MKSYSELLTLQTFKERYNYLRMPSEVGIQTFGYERYINQQFYNSREWKHIRKEVILRDQASDLGILDRPIYGNVRVHHMNPISIEDFEKEQFDKILNLEFLICVSLDTHNAIHYGTELNLKIGFSERKQNDTKMW